MSRNEKILLVVASVATLALITCLVSWAYVMRRPRRNTPGDSNVFTSPANGRITSIRPWQTSAVIEAKHGTAGEFVKLWTSDIGATGNIISITLTLTDVHYQRSPTDATVTGIKHVDGQHRMVDSSVDEPLYENEHCEILLTTPTGLTYKVVMIAGMVFRRIEALVKVGHQVKQGEVISRIQFGSQVALLLPAGVDINCCAGDYVIDGETVIASMPK